MAFAGGKRSRSGLDGGSDVAAKERSNKKKKRQGLEKTATETEVESNKATEVPSIRPGEKLSDFATRVDAALPLNGLLNRPVKNGKDPLGLKVWRTKKERKMHKLYDEWREQDRKIKERREEELELAEEKAMEEDELGLKWQIDDVVEAGGSSTVGKRKKNKGGKKRERLLGEVAEREADPWEELRRKRGEARVGLHDVAQAPPELQKMTGKKLTVRGAAVEVGGIPKAAGSLRRREELQGVRNEVVASYRKMMDQKRAKMASGAL